MKYLKTTILTLILVLSITLMQAQIKKYNLNKPIIKTQPRISLPSSATNTFDNILFNLGHGICYKIIMVSIQLPRSNYWHTWLGYGDLLKDGNELKSVFRLHKGLKEPRLGGGTAEAIIRISKNREKAKIDLRFYYTQFLFNNAKIVKKKNGYFITVKNNNINNSTVSFTFAIYRTNCSI